MHIKTYFHVNNGGLTVGIKDNKFKIPIELYAEYNHMGVSGPKCVIPLINLNQVEEMIALLEKAKQAIINENEYDKKFSYDVDAGVRTNVVPKKKG